MLMKKGEVVARMVFHTLPGKPGDFVLVKGGKLLVNVARGLRG
jgi:hypothetical protein